LRAGQPGSFAEQVHSPENQLTGAFVIQRLPTSDSRRSIVPKSIALPGFRLITGVLVAVLALMLFPSMAMAGEAKLIMPDLNSSKFFGGAIGGHTLLLWGLVICVAGLIFGLVINSQLKNLPVHPSMREVSETIYATCRTYLMTQGKFILLLQVFIAVVLIAYFGFFAKDAKGDPLGIAKVLTILLFSLVGIAGSYAVAWFGIRVNTYANSRTAMASLAGKPYPVYAIPLKAGISIGMVLISLELLIMLGILLFMPADYAGPCFIGFAVGESLGAAALRVAGGIFTKIADIGADLMKIVFNVKEDDARNPGVIADCVGDNAGDSVGPSADGFETYGVTGVALITFILLAVPQGIGQIGAAGTNLAVTLLVWIFVMRLVMVVTSALSYFINEAFAKAKYADAKEMDFEKPLTNLVFISSGLSIAATFLVSYFLLQGKLMDDSLWWKLSAIITCGTLAGALIPEFTKFFTSTHSAHVREIVDASREGGASLNVLSGLTAGNFSAFWLGLVIAGLMAGAFLISTLGVSELLKPDLEFAAAVFAFGLVAFGFLGMGPVTIAVDSYGPVTDNAQSVYELSLIEQIDGIKGDLKRDFNVDADFERAKLLLEENDGAGNTFKATAKPVLIGTAVVGATTMIFSIILVLIESVARDGGKVTGELTAVAMDPAKAQVFQNLSILHAPFLLGLIMGGATIYWFTGATTQAVVTGAYRAVEFIKKNMRLDAGYARASIDDSKKVVAICTRYAQSGMLNIFLTGFFITLAFAFLDPYFFIGFLVSMATFGLFQAVFMANAGGAWDNAKKVVEVELRAKNTPLHAATVVGDTVGDPFKDTSSVAMNPIIKFTTLFGLLAVELALELRTSSGSNTLTTVLAVVLFIIALIFIWRSFYAMRIKST
jgi:K(+)-stimulated pyrophosphate-energized sodium pump